MITTLTRVLFAVSALLAVGAVSARAAEPAVKGDGGKVRLLYYPSGTNAFPAAIIPKLGLDKKYGFEIVPVPTASPATMATAIQSGAGDIGMFGWNDTARMRNAGVKIIGVAPFLTFGADFIVVLKDSPIKTYADLKGKKVGVPSRVSINTIAMRAIAEQKYHFDLMKDSSMQDGAPTLLWALLEQGQLDASEIFNSVVPSMMVTGKFRILTNIKAIVDQLGLPETPYLFYSADETFAKAHPDNVRAFLAANAESIEIMRKDDDVWVEPAKPFNMTPEALASFRAEARADLQTKFKATTEADLRKTFDLLLATAGADAMGMSVLPAGFMTLDYQ